jgi:glycosyltransferase 2 family protein
VIRSINKALTTGLIVWILLQQIGLEAVLRQLSYVDPGSLVLATALSLMLAVFAGLRWYGIIQTTGHHLPRFKVLQITMIGSFFNQLLPSAMGGDLARIPYAQRAGLPLHPAVHSVVLDRIVAFVALILLVVVCLPASFSVLPDLRARWALTTIAAGGFAGTAFLLAIEHLPRVLTRHAVLMHLRILSSLLRAAIFGRQAVAIVVFGIMSHLIRVLAVYALAHGMNLDISVYEILILVPPAMLVTALPISMGGWGVREGAFVVAFGLTGVDPDKAFALSAVFGMTTLFAGLIGGFFWIAHQKHR